MLKYASDVDLKIALTVSVYFCQGNELVNKSIYINTAFFYCVFQFYRRRALFKLAFLMKNGDYLFLPYFLKLGDVATRDLHATFEYLRIQQGSAWPLSYI